MDCRNEIERLNTELDKANMDENMLRHKALELAKKCISGKYFSTTSITAMPKDDPSSAVIASFLGKMDVQQKAIQK